MAESQPVILITGAGGRIGSALSERFRNDYQIIALDRPGSSDSANTAQEIMLDVADDASVRDALAQVRQRYGRRIASVFHLAAYYSFSGDPDPRYTTVNIEGTRRLLRALQEFEVEQFVYASTMLVHAPTQPGVPIAEDAPLQPAWDYPRSKLAAEAVVQSEHGVIPYVILRLAGIYNDEGDLPALAQQIARIDQRSLTSHLFPGDPTHGQSALHIDDLVGLCARLVDRRRNLPNDLVLLAGEPVTPSYGELQDRLGELLHGEPWATRVIPKTLAEAGAWLQEVALPESKEPFIKHWMVELADDHYELDIRRAQALLDWTSRHTLLETLPRIVAELRRDPGAWYRANHLDVPAADVEPVPCEQAASEPPQAAVADDASAAHHSHNANSAHAEGKSEHKQLLAMHHATLWPHYINLALGLWLIASPFVLGYFSDYVPDANALRAFAERGLESFATHNRWMAWSDIASGVLVAALSVLAADPRRRFAWSQWAIAVLGTWLMFAPLVFWTPLPEAANNGALVGMLLIVFSVLVPMMPGMSMAGMTGGPDIPPGWSYTPSTETQRFPIAALALIGWFISRYLAAYQMGHTDRAWDPVFQHGEGTMR